MRKGHDRKCPETLPSWIEEVKADIPFPFRAESL